MVKSDLETLWLENKFLRIRVQTLGARIDGIWQKADHRAHNHVLSLPKVDDYQDDAAYLGALVGRYANRLRGGVMVEGQHFPLALNEGNNCLHGGRVGFSQKNWAVTERNDQRAVLGLRSPDGDQGLPGTLDVTCEIELRAQVLSVQYTAVTDRPTAINLTHHPYFNLSGERDARDHILTVDADQVLLVNDVMIPTQTVDVDLAGMDLRQGRPASDFPGGLDHCFLCTSGVRARIDHPTGRWVAVTSDAPAVQIYTGQGLGEPWGPFAGVCAEPQSPPNAPNQPGLGDTILRPGDVWRRSILYELGMS